VHWNVSLTPPASVRQLGAAAQPGTFIFGQWLIRDAAMLLLLWLSLSTPIMRAATSPATLCKSSCVWFSSHNPNTLAHGNSPYNV